MSHGLTCWIDGDVQQMTILTNRAFIILFLLTSMSIIQPEDKRNVQGTEELSVGREKNCFAGKTIS